MDRSSISRLLLIGASVFLLMTFLPQLFGGKKGEHQPLRAETHVLPAASERPKEQLCDLWTPEFRAQLSTRGASLKHFELRSAKYLKKKNGPIDLATTPDHELYQQLRFDFRNGVPAGNAEESPWQVDFDSVDWTLERATGKACEFSYRDRKVELRKTISLTGRPYELSAVGTIKNLGDRPLPHALAVETDAWRTKEEVSGGMFRVSPLLTHVECVLDTGKTTRLETKAFEPSAFENTEHFPTNERNNGNWYEVPGKPDVAAVSNAYFSHALVPVRGPGEPVCQLQIQERPPLGALYRARLAYPRQMLEPGADRAYEVLTYVGPKERSLLAAAAGGHSKLSELIDLGFFTSIAKVLVAFLLKVHSVVPNWGIAIIILTITARLLLFPLAVPSIKGMIKMRELKPEIDAINEKFKDDPQAKGLAQMELWRKHKVNPLKGCLPQLASMPVWFALYTTLQTAVELYNIPFLWFPDLSAPDPLYILPFVIGGTSFLQQKMMPMQGDPAQQKMLLYFMPAMFTVFMLFLPAGLGVYMFTNGVLGIIQQQVVERHVRRTLGKPGGSSDIKVKVVDETPASGKKGDASGNGKKGKKSDPKLSGDDAPLLGNGKA
jgi:YidC/Oxa1 family membrane protein insertase